jgi:hypothetical protein
MTPIFMNREKWMSRENDKDFKRRKMIEKMGNDVDG